MQEEVKNGIISVEQAKEVYGVVVDAETFTVDDEGTKRLRGSYKSV